MVKKNNQWGSGEVSDDHDLVKMTLKIHNIDFI